MSHTTINILYYTSLVFGLGGGLALYIWWLRRMWKRIANSKTVVAAKLKMLFHVFIGLFFLILCCVPCFYFNNLLKREAYCKQIVEVNKGIKKDDPFIKEKCSCIDIDALFKNQQP